MKWNKVHTMNLISVLVILFAVFFCKGYIKGVLEGIGFLVFSLTICKMYKLQQEERKAAEENK